MQKWRTEMSHPFNSPSQLPHLQYQSLFLSFWGQVVIHLTGTDL